jgi:hypothetical protein
MPSIGRAIKVPSLEDLPQNVDPQLRTFLEALIYAIDIREGRIAPGTNTRFVTIQDLVDAGVVSDGDIT